MQLYFKYEGGDETAGYYIPNELHFDMIMAQSHTFGGDCSFNQQNIWIRPRENVCHVTVVLSRGNFHLLGEDKGGGILILVQILEPTIYNKSGRPNSAHEHDYPKVTVVIMRDNSKSKCVGNIYMSQVLFNFYDHANSSATRLVSCSEKFCEVGLGTKCSHRIN
ncbi:hypothetical protein DVH24_009430 [Malus domestica]|uniref:Uncharacterized protein n=1 Tax=Malus domestica TaxID=3750 RepID=A0A498IQY0_MALDO|nr:hypothetical protein DVH24_009430 [Malus domestica]